MYKLLFIFFLTVSCRELKSTQTVNVREIKQELKKLQDFGDAYAKEMDTWSEEYRKWFVKNFFYVRGQIKIPTEPMTTPPPKY